MQKTYHNISGADTLLILNSNLDFGLTEKQVLKRRVVFEERFLNLKVFLRPFKKPFVLILSFLFIFVLFLGEFNEALALFFLIAFYIIFSFFLEKKIKEIKQEGLKSKVFVLRNGKKQEVFEDKLVIGDIIFLKSGDKIPLKARILQAKNLNVLEEQETGEWAIREKNVDILERETEESFQKNILFKNGIIHKGEGVAVIVEAFEKVKDDGVYSSSKMKRFNYIVSFFVVLLSFVLFLIGFLKGLDLVLLIKVCSVLMASALPEVLSLVFLLFYQTKKRFEGVGIVKSFSLAFNLSSIQTLLFDKKTITRGLRLKNVIAKDGELAIKASLLCPLKETKEAVLRVAKRKKYDVSLLEEIQKLDFNASNNYALSLRKEENKRFLYISGDPLQVLKRSKGSTHEWEEEVLRLREKGLKVIAVGFKEIKRTSKDLNKIAKNFDFIGLLAFLEPLNMEVVENIKECERMGIRPVLMTRSSVLNAKVLGEKIGFDLKEENILKGDEMDVLNDAELGKKLRNVQIFAEIRSRHKLRIVYLLQKQENVLFVGEYLNDIFAMKKAKTAITFKTKEEGLKVVSDVVLAKNGLGSVLECIKLGEDVCLNFKKSILFYLASFLLFFVLLGFSIINGWPLPLLGIQILIIAVLKRTLLLSAFSFEKRNFEMMKKKKAFIFVFFSYLINASLILGTFYFLYFVKGIDLGLTRMMIFILTFLILVLTLFYFKNLKRNVWNTKVFSNTYLNLICVLFFLSCVALSYVFSIDFLNYLFLFLIGFLGLFLMEILKYFMCIKD